MKPLCRIETPFAEKFGVPRQSLLVGEAWGKLAFPKDDFFCEAFRGIDGSSHLWLIFEFDQVPAGPVNGLVRPPRFENKQKLGVFATRSPHRPNRLGLSLVRFDRLEVTDREVILWVSGVDIVTGTPILDIKPYVPYADSVAARTPFTEAPARYEVRWACEKVAAASLIEKVIGLDPRPNHERGAADDEYGVSVAGFNVRFRFLVDHFEIVAVTRLP
jgi:tRNA-Thr(GGU) m(6)t(6)A37 methyltransferase TsaA